MQKKAYPIRKPDCPKRNIRRCNVFCFKMDALVHRNLLLQKSVKKVKKIKFHTRNRHSAPSSSTVFVGVKIFWQLYLFFFFFWLTLLVFSDVLSLFHVVPYLNLVVWVSHCCHFCVISILFVRYWGPMEFVSFSIPWKGKERRWISLLVLSLKWHSLCFFD